jgi:hypothetical protein
MTTWDNTDISKKYRNYPGKFMEITYEITGVSGDTGGTLTCSEFKKILNAIVTASTSSAAVAALTKAIVSNTVIVTYTNPAASHTVKITVFGLKA